MSAAEVVALFDAARAAEWDACHGDGSVEAVAIAEDRALGAAYALDAGLVHYSARTAERRVRDLATNTVAL